MNHFFMLLKWYKSVLPPPSKWSNSGGQGVITSWKVYTISYNLFLGNLMVGEFQWALEENLFYKNYDPWKCVNSTTLTTTSDNPDYPTTTIPSTPSPLLNANDGDGILTSRRATEFLCVKIGVTFNFQFAGEHQRCNET